MKISLSAALFGVLILSVPTFGQVKKYRTNVATEPFTWVLYSYEAASDFENDNEVGGKVAIHEIEVLATPVYVEKEAYQAVMGIGFKQNQFVFEDVPQDDVDVYTITLPMDLIVPHDEWTFWGNVTPGLLSDLEDISGDDFRVMIYGMAMYDWKPNVQLAFGAAYDRVFGDDEIFPLGGVVWQIGEQCEINMILPMPRVTYAPSEKVQIFADVRPAGGVWNMYDEETDTDFDFKLEGYRFGMGFEYEVARHIWLHAAAGFSTERTYEFGEGNEQVFEAEADDTYFGRIGFIVR